MKLSNKKQVEGCKCKAVSEKQVKRYMKKVVPEMINFMCDNLGLGLAAPQIGIKKTFFVMVFGDKALLCFNPSWEPHGDKQKLSNEGCLSYPKESKEVSRYKMIDAEFTGSKGIKRYIRLRGLDAVVFQHECDHLEGKTIFFS